MIKFLKIRDVKDPERELGNAGIDVFVPNHSYEFVGTLLEKNPTLTFSGAGFWVNPGEAVLIPLGLKTRFSSPNIALEATNKSGIATKKKLLFGATLVDYSYKGEIHAHLINVGMEPQFVGYGDKIIQFVPRIIDIEQHEVVEGEDEEAFYAGFESKRGSGAFGSTGS